MGKTVHVGSSVVDNREVYFLVMALFGYIVAYIDPYSSKGFPQYINFFVRGIVFLLSIYFIIKNFSIIKKRKIAVVAFMMFFSFYLFKIINTLSNITLPSDISDIIKDSVYYFGLVVIPLPVIALLSLDYHKIDFNKFNKIIFWFLMVIMGANFIYTNFIAESYLSNGRSGIFRSYYIFVGHYGLSLVILSLFGFLFIKSKWHLDVSGLLLGFFPIFVSAARSPILAFFIIAFAFLIILNNRKYWMYFCIAIILSFIALFVSYQTGLGESSIFFERLNSAIFEKNASGRSFFLNKGIEEFISHPWLGGKALFEDGMYPHNLFVDILMSTGLLGMALFIIYLKFVVQSFIKILKYFFRYKESGVLIFFFLQYFILVQTSGNLYSSVEFWYFSAVVIGLGYINFTNEEIKSNDSRRYATRNH